MPTITISRLTGSDDGSFGKELAEKLGYDFIDKERIHEAALAASGSENEANAIDALQAEAPGEIVLLLQRILREEEEGAREKFLTPWFRDAYPFDLLPYYDTDYVRYSQEELETKPERKPLTKETSVAGYQQIIRFLAERGRAVIVGRASQVILKDVPWVFHLRLTSSRKHRIENVAEMMRLHLDEAEKYMDRSDQWRARFVRDNFDADWTAPELYHMSISMDRWKSYKLIEAISSVVESNTFHTTLQDLKKHYRWNDGGQGPVRRGV